MLEASYVVMRLPPYHRDFGKRLVKTPKLYFLDVGLAAWLLGIRDADTASVHAQRGALFETLVVSEFAKQRFHSGRTAELFFWRDSAGHEVDLLFETSRGLQAVEIKSGATFATDWLDSLRRFRALPGIEACTPWVIYGGKQSHARETAELIGWRDLPKTHG